MRKAIVFVLCIFIWLSASAGIEPYENFIKGKVKRSDTLIVKDEKFQNPKYNWSDITNISVNNAVSFRIIDEALLTKSFSCQIRLKVEYLNSPGQQVPASQEVELKVNYSIDKGANYKVSDSYAFQNAYWVRVIVENIYSPEYDNELPPNFQLTGSITIDRQYRFKPGEPIKPNAAMVGGAASSTGTGLKPRLLMSLSGGTGTGLVNSNNQLQLTWAIITGAEEYDVEWTTVNDGNPYYATVQAMSNGTAGIIDPSILNKLFLHNASRLTTHAQSTLLSLAYTDNFIVVRMRQVQYATDGFRLLGDWDYKQDNNHYSAWPLGWYQTSLNWQYSASFAEEGKKKEVVSYFDGSLRGRQTVTINNSDNVAVVQENIYDEFGRATASILPAPIKEDGTANPYLHYFKDLSLNNANTAYNAANAKGTASTSCEFNPDPLKTSSGASLYYSPQNPFLGGQSFNKFIPDAEGYPISVSQYTPDNTGRVSVQGGVGKTLQPGRTSPSKAIKYYYGKPEQWELDQLFGNDVGYANHYFKNAVIDPNGQASISYLNSSGKTIATALTGKAPAGMDSLATIVPAKIRTANILDPSKFVFDNSSLKISATTTYLASVSGATKLKYSIEKLIEGSPGGANTICSNCYYDVVIKVVDDCSNIIYNNTSAPIQIGSKISDCYNHGFAEDSISLNLPEIGQYYFTVELAFSKTVMENYVDNFINTGQAVGFVRKSFSFIRPYLDSIDYKGCLSDCKTNVQVLGSKADFGNFFKTKLIALDADSASVYSTDFQNWADQKWEALKLYCDSTQAACNSHPSVSPCERYERPMLEDVSPGGQYALFTDAGIALEPQLNVIGQNWRTEFPVLSADQEAYQAEAITLPNGDITSPYDASFTLPLLVQYWKTDWAAKFLKYHPEFCKLQFCYNTSAFKSWDEQVQNDFGKATDIASLPNAPAGLHYDRTNAAWLLAADTFFQAGGPGAGYKASMESDLLNYSVAVLKNTTASLKGLTQFVDYLTYCSDVNGNTNTLKDPYNNWDNCAPVADCRVPDREWSTYRDFYFELKEKYYDKLRAATTCANACPVGTPISLPSGSACPSAGDFSLGIYSAADGPPTNVCAAPLQTVSLSYVGGKVSTAATVTISYPAGLGILGLQTVFQFAAGEGQKTFCIPLGVPVQSLSIQSVVCTACQPNGLLFNSWDNDHILQKTYDGSGNVVSTATLTPDSSAYFTGSLAIVPGNTYHAYTPYGNYTANWEMDRNCQFALYSRGVKYLLSSVTGQQLALSHREGNIEEIWYLNATASAPVCSSPTVLTVAEVASSNTYYTGVYPNRHLLTIIAGPAGTPPAFNGVNDAGQTVGSTSAYYTCLSIQTTSATASFSNVWVFDIVYDSAPANCQAVYLSKAARFETVNPNIITGDLDGMVQGKKDELALQVQNACDANADGWMAALSAGLSGRPAADSIALRAALLQVCAMGGDLSHPFGASSVPPGQATAAGYSSFGDAIKGVLQLPNFTNTLNPWLIGAPNPYATQQQIGPLTISRSSADICTQLQLLQSQADGASLSLFAYLTQTFGSSMTLSADDLSELQKSCTQCRFLLSYDIQLPAFMQPGAKGCVLPTEYSAAKANLQAQFGSGGISTADANYPTILANFLNQRWGFTLSYDQYMEYEAALVTSPSKTLCNGAGLAADLPQNPLDCIGSQIAAAAANGSREYEAYLIAVKNSFRNNYINTCSAARANFGLSAAQKIYHYTLYYYDQADNLIRTIPPEGVQLLEDSALPAVQTYRDQYAIAEDLDKYYQHPVYTDKPTVLDSLSHLFRKPDTIGKTIEMWLYNPAQSGNQVVATTPDHRFLFQTCINGTQMSIDVLSLDSTVTGSVSVLAANHYTVDISTRPSLGGWQHVVLMSNDFVAGTMQAYVNGQLMPAVSGSPYAGCGLNIGPGGLASNTPDNFTTLKHLRLYSRLMDASEIYKNVHDPYFRPSNDVTMYWFRANIPEPGSVTTIGTLNTDEFLFKPVFPQHRMATTYTYNSTNQVSKQQSPDGGVNRFWYDLLSRLSISQNDKQLPGNDYSYTTYDILGRITEVSQKKQTTIALGDPDYLADATLGSFAAAGTDSQITHTYYDVAAPATNGMQSVTQNNLRKRVASSTYRDTQTGQVQQATYYDYDLDGNVKTLYQQLAGLELKRIDYEYDLVSGKVNFAAYQKNQPDQFYYSYNYDAENRLTEAWSSPLATLSSYSRGSTLNTTKRRMDASYKYYLHGPLARMELGDVSSKVQGVDYAYTLQGWLKGVNRSIFRFQPQLTTDMGNDGSNGVPKDAFNYNLYYYLNDYKPIQGTDPFEHELQEDPTFYPLYNGNIAGIGQTLPAINQASMVNSYRYDQLNRLTVNQPRQNNLPYALPEYDTMDEFFSYDGNGNIKTAFRHGDFFAAKKEMDDLTYNYNRDAQGKLINNKLRHVNDALPYYGSNNPQDLHDQVADNYQYDAIGNLIVDQQGAISNIKWTVYGKIDSITKTDGPSIKYRYDPSGQRASKTVNGLTTWYVRDAQGNTMAVYDNKSNQINWKEQDLYGSSRLGMWEPNVNLASNNAATVWDTVGHKEYELANHLGNVLVTITDKRLPHSTDGTTIDYYEPEVRMAQEYFAFGAPIPKRNYFLNDKQYRYGFNGKENDNEVKLDWSGNPINGSQQDYGMRIYDPRLGRFLSVDPLTKQYPELTPYQFASNSPISGIDKDGLEFNFYGTKIVNERGTAKIKVTGLKKAASITIKTEVGEIPGPDIEINLEKLGIQFNFVKYKGEYVTMPTGYSISNLPSLNSPEWDKTTSYAEIQEDFQAASTAFSLVDFTSIKNGFAKLERKTFQISALRKKARELAWKEEAELVRKRGFGTRDWSESEIEELLNKGRVDGYAGHHIKDVKNFPEEAGNPNNITFRSTGGGKRGARKGSEHYNEHFDENGNRRGSTNGELINRQELINGE